MAASTPTPGDPGLETPVAPVPAPARKAARKERPAASSPRRKREKRGAKKRRAAADPASAGPIKLGYRYAGRISGRLLLFVLLVQLVLGLTVVLPFWQGVSEHLDHHPHAAALAGSPTAADRALGWEAGLHPGVWADVQRELSGLFDGLTIVHFWIALVAWLFGAVAAGGFLGTAVSGENPVRVRAFLASGGRYFGRMLRVGLVFAFFYYLTARIVFEAWGLSSEPTEFAQASETAGWWGDRLRELVLVLCFLWFRVAADWARSDLVVYGRTGALGAFFRGLGHALRPRIMWRALSFGVPALLLLVGLGFVAQLLTGDGLWTLLLLFLVTQLAVGVRWAARAGVLATFAASHKAPGIKTT